MRRSEHSHRTLSPEQLICKGTMARAVRWAALLTHPSGCGRMYIWGGVEDLGNQCQAGLASRAAYSMLWSLDLTASRFIRCKDLGSNMPEQGPRPPPVVEKMTCFEDQASPPTHRDSLRNRVVHQCQAGAHPALGNDRSVHRLGFILDAHCSDTMSASQNLLPRMPGCSPSF